MKIEKWGWYSIGINIFLAGIDLAVAVSSGSLAVKTEILHNMVDLLTAIAVLIGLKLASRKTRKFPYGLYKVENVIAVVMAMVIFFTAYEMGRHAILAPSFDVTVSLWHLVALMIAGGVAMIFSFLEFRAGRQSNSPALVADAKEYRVHIFTTSVVLAALAGHNIDLPLDRIAAFIVLMAIAKTGWDLLASGISVLLDASLEPKAIKNIEEMISSEPEVAAVHWITGRNAGRVRFVEAEVSLRISNLDRAEKITTRIENKVKKKLQNIERVVIHAEPIPRKHILCAVPLKNKSGELSLHFGDAPFFALLKVGDKNEQVESRNIESNPFVDLKKRKGIKVAEWLVEKKIDRVYLLEGLGGKGPQYVFGNAGIDIKIIDHETLSGLIKNN